MSADEQTKAVVQYWREKAREALASARDEAEAGRPAFAMNRAYYAAVYAASAVLLAKGLQFKKHSGVRAAVHLQLVKPGLLGQDWGRFYDRLFNDRHEADYVEFVKFTREEVDETIGKTEDLLAALDRLFDR
jgi:uncharacterized protein (UPF0332 family)